MIGQRIGSYEVVRLIGEGGMGAVYEAVHDTLQRRAAVKVLRPQLDTTAELLLRLVNEARAVNIIRHPGIVDIYEFGEMSDGTVYIIMEFLEGQSLRNLLREQDLETAVLLRLAQQIASALAAAHQKGIIHRDLKPDNVIVVADPAVTGGRRTKLLDFGIAKMSAGLGGPGAMELVTQTGALMGTPVYMSPEQCRGTSATTDRSDVYSLGILLYQMIAGAPPFVSTGVGELIGMHMFTPPKPLRDVVPSVSTAVAELVASMLAKDPTERPAMAQVAVELERLASLPTEREVPGKRRWRSPAPPVALVTTLGQSAGQSAPQQNRAKGWLLAPVGLVLLLLGAGYYLGQRGEPVDQEAVANRALVAGETSLRNHQWQEASARAAQVLALAHLSADSRDTARSLRTKAEREQKIQGVYESVRAAAQAENHDQALQLFQQIPADSVYRKLGRDIIDRSKAPFSAVHLKKAREAREQGQCAVFTAEVQRVVDLVPDQQEAQALQQQPCVSKGQGGGAAMRPIDEEVAKRLLTQAQEALAAGDYTQPIELLRPLTLGGSASLLVNIRARRIVGAAACHLHDLRLAAECYRGLEPDGQAYLDHVCKQSGVVCLTRGWCKLDE